MSPEELSRFHDGDEAVFAALVAAHSPQLLAAAVQLVADRARAHDLVHDTWVHAYQKRRAFTARGSFVGWMLVLLRNCWHAEFRSDARRAARDATYVRSGDTTHDPSGSVHESLDQPGRRARIIDAVALLGERQRDVVVMRLIEERSVADTARALGIAEGTVKATLFQAIQRLRATLRELAP